MKNFPVYLMLAFLAFSSCKNEPKFRADLIFGSWNGIDWKIEGKSSDIDAGAVNFVFAPYGKDESAPQGTYLATFGDQKERGTFQLKGDKLYTTAEDKQEKVVRVQHLTSDTLILDMNRAGRQETLTLVERH